MCWKHKEMAISLSLYGLLKSNLMAIHKHQRHCLGWFSSTYQTGDNTTKMFLFSMAMMVSIVDQTAVYKKFIVE